MERRESGGKMRSEAGQLQDAVEGFRRAMLEAGLRPEEVVDTGERALPERCPVGDDRPGERSGWYVFFGDGMPAGAFGNWRTGQSWTWCAREQGRLSPSEREALARKMEAVRLRREAARRELAATAAERARADWARAEACAGHPYLERKGVLAYGIRVLEGRLLVPVCGVDGEIRSMQTITATGEKRFFSGGEKKGCFFRIAGRGRVAVCEGYATGASVHEATGWTVLVAFDAGNLLPVARAWQQAHPADRLLVCGDDDAYGHRNPGREKAEACAAELGLQVCFPRFAVSGEQPTDWNDLHRLEGLEVVRTQLLSGGRGHFLSRLSPEGPYPTSRYVREVPPALRWAFRNVALMGSPFVLCGAGGTGKTSLSLQLAASLATGRALLGPVFTPGVRGRTLVLLCEDPEEPIWQRVWQVAQALGEREREAFERMVNIQICLGEDMRLVRNDPVRGLVTTEAFEALQELAGQTPELAAIILDPLNLLHGADVERSEEAAQFFCSKLAQLGKTSGAAVIVVHHSVKNGTGRGSRFSLDEVLHVDTVRGSGAIVAGMRGACILTTLPGEVARKTLGLAGLPRPGEYLAGRIGKVNYAARQGTFFLRRGENGLLYPVEPLRQGRSNPAADILPRVCGQVAHLVRLGRPVTRRMFIRMYDTEWQIPRSVLDAAIERALFEGWLVVRTRCNATGRKTDYLEPGAKYGPDVFAVGEVRDVPQGTECQP